LYESIYGKKAGYIVGLGLIEKESLLIRKNLLLLLKRKYSLAIATGRPRPEALYTLRRFELETGFHADMVVAFEDAAYPKPSPDPLITAAGRAGGKNCVYIGDTISDIEAAERAGMFSVYIGKEKMDQFLNSLGNLVPIKTERELKREARGFTVIVSKT